MCMNISKEDIVRINEGFDGRLVRPASLDFALDLQKNKKMGSYKKLAYLWRAILVDHPFTDGNKRTAMFLSFEFAHENKKQVDNELIKHHILSIAQKNIIEIKNIEWRLKNAIN